ncbi:MAG: hypothetical protein ACLGSA_05325 [Acidobacteriota bacterium]
MRRSLLLILLISLLLTSVLPTRAADTQPPAPGPTIVPVTMQLAMPPTQDAKQAATPHEPMPETLLYAVIFLGYGLLVVSVLFIFAKLRTDPQWSLGRALSENTVVEQQDPDDACKKKLVYIDLPSTSRLIAFLGMIVLLSIFLALGTVMVWTLGRTGKIISLGDAQNFLWAGLSMFAPYLISQGRDALKAFGCAPDSFPLPPTKTPQAPGNQPNTTPPQPPVPTPVPTPVPVPQSPPPPGGSGKTENC